MEFRSWDGCRFSGSEVLHVGAGILGLRSCIYLQDCFFCGPEHVHMYIYICVFVCPYRVEGWTSLGLTCKEFLTFFHLSSQLKLHAVQGLQFRDGNHANGKISLRQRVITCRNRPRASAALEDTFRCEDSSPKL